MSHATSRAPFRGALLGLALLAGCATARSPELRSSEGDGATASPAELRTIEVRANTFTRNTQDDPVVAADSRGRLLAVWASRRQEFNSFGVFAQLLDPLGRPLTRELHVNQYVPNNQREPYAAFGPDDTAWIVWSSAEPDTAKNGVFLRRFAGEGLAFAPLEGELPVEVAPHGFLSDPAIAVDEEGRALVTWVANRAGTRRIEARLLDPSGAPIGPAFLPGAEKSVLESHPDVVALPGGGFFLAWSRTDRRGAPLGLLGRPVARGPEEAPVLGEVLALSPRDERQHVEPSLAADGAGRLLVAWMSTDGNGAHRVLARRFDADLAPLGEILRIDTGARGQVSGASAACAPDGRFLVAYNDYTAKIPHPPKRPERQIDVRARAFDAGGTPLGEEFQVNRPGPGRHRLGSGGNGRRVLWTERGQLACAWWGRVEGDAKDVAVTLLAPEALDLPAPPEIEPLAAAGDVSLEDYRRMRAKPDPLPPSERDRLRIPSRAGLPGGFLAHDQTGWIPPDPDLAVGPNHIVSQVNQEIAWFTKKGVEEHRQNNANAGGFWSALGAEDFVFDPIALWDPHSQRFVVANSELASDGDYLVLAVSKTTDPNDGWWKYRHKVTPACGFPDFPNLGVDENAIYIFTDCFNNGGNTAFAYDKAIVANGLPLAAPISVTTAGGNLISLANTKNYDTGSPAHYGVTAYSSTNTELDLYAITDVLGSPSVSTFALSVPVFNQPPDAPQMGSANLLDTIDWRIKHATVRGGHLYAAHGIDPGAGIAKVRWYDIDLRGWPASGNTPVLAQSGTLNLGPGVNTWFPDVSVDAAGNITMAFSRSAAGELPSIQYTTHPAGSPAGTTTPPVTLQTSTQPYTAGRWGDYSGIDEDPARPGTFWSHNEYSEGPWMTWIAQWTVTPAGVTSRNGSGVNPSVLTALNLPLLGTSFLLNVDASAFPASTLTVVQSYANPSSGVILNLGELLVDVSLPPLSTSVSVVGGGGQSTHGLALPADPFLAGETLSLQAGIVGGGVQLTNALDATFNF